MRNLSHRIPTAIAVTGLALALLFSRKPSSRAEPSLVHRKARHPALEHAVVADDIRTTNPQIALGNLEAQIRQSEQRCDRADALVGERAARVELLLAHGQYTGSIADRERALALGDDLGRTSPTEPIALLARARGRAAFHRFDEALADLQRASELGASPSTIADLRASIYQALGRYDEALVIRRMQAGRNPNADTLGALASVLAQRGDTDDAARIFDEARWSYRDVSPFPLAFLLFDEGAMWMRHGDLGRARVLFESALRRLPDYAAARCHLAEVDAALGEIDTAVALLEPLAQNADDPEAAALLARILTANGRADAALPWRRQAAQRYQELVAAYPDAYAPHAAEFWISAGIPSQRDLRIARSAPPPRRLALVNW